MKIIILTLYLVICACRIHAQDVQSHRLVSYKTLENFEKQNPDATLYLSGRIKYCIHERLDGSECLTILNDDLKIEYKPEKVYLVQVGDRKFRSMPKKQYAKAVYEDGLVLYENRYKILPFVPYLSRSYFWFSEGLEKEAHKLNRREIRKTFADQPEFVFAVEQEFGKRWIPLFTKSLYRKSKNDSSSYEIGILYNKFVAQNQ